MLETITMIKNGARMGAVMILVVFLASAAHGQDIPRGGLLNCGNLPEGVTATATLQWTKAGTSEGASDSWSCGGDATDSHDTMQPANADGWRLTIEFTGTTTASPASYSWSSFPAGKPEHIREKAELPSVKNANAVFRVGH